MSKQREYRRIITSFTFFDIPKLEEEEIRQALEDPRWDWHKDCDGCTAVSEAGWPSKYFPPCVRHDYDWFVGNDMIKAQNRFYRLNRCYGMGRCRASVRYVGTYAGWICYGWWRNRVFGYIPANKKEK